MGNPLAVPYFAEVSLADRYVTRFITEPEPPFPGLVRMKETGIFSPQSEGIELPADAFPRAAREQRRVKDMPDFLQLHYWYGVCEEFKAWVEELDPGVHQFSERIAVSYNDGRPAEKAYYAINPRGHLSGTCIAERTTRDPSAGGGTATPTDLLHLEDHLEFDEAAIGGRHFWKDTDFNKRAWFLSDELGRRLLEAKLKKLILVRHRLGRR